MFHQQGQEAHLDTNNSLLRTGGKHRSIFPVVYIPRGDFCIGRFPQRIGRALGERDPRHVVRYDIK
jgi:hypothetical protein